MKSPIQIIIAIAVLLAAVTVTAQVYKWVDKDGKVQYSDIPPPPNAKVDTQKLSTKSASGPAAPEKALPANAKDATKDDKGKAATKGAPKSLAERVKESDKKREEDAAAAKKAAEDERYAKATEARCKDASRYLADLSSGRPIGGADEKGERKLLDDDARAAEIVRARAAMTESCKK